MSGGARRHVALIVDTETTGLPVNDKPIWDACQPWPVEIAALLVQQDEPGGELRIRATVDMIVQVPVEIPEETVKLHGIDTDTMRRLGVSMRCALGTLYSLMGRADVVVAHHAPFDRQIIESACHRAHMPFRHESIWRCTKVAARALLPEGASSRLADARRELCGKETPNWHSALPDAEACLDLYRELRARGSWRVQWVRDGEVGYWRMVVVATNTTIATIEPVGEAFEARWMDEPLDARDSVFECQALLELHAEIMHYNVQRWPSDERGAAKAGA